MISEDDKVVLSELNSISENGTNNIITSYLQNLAYFHRDKKVRNNARQLIEQYLPQETINFLDQEFTKTSFKKQEYYYKWLVYHEKLVVGEYSLLASVIRRNYFKKYQATGYNLYMDGRDNDIRNALNISLPLDSMPDKIKYLDYIDYVDIGLQINLDLSDLFEKLSLLPKLRTLILRQSNIESMPIEIYKLQTLERLCVYRNPLKMFSSEGVFSNLKELDISETEITELNLKSFPQLETLRVSGKEQFYRIRLFNICRNLTVTSGKYYSETLPKSNTLS